MVDAECHIGDLVQIKTREEIKQEEDFQIGWASAMYSFCGEVVEIKNIKTYSGFTKEYIVYEFKERNEFDGINHWLWTANMFNPYTRITEPQESEIVNLLL